MEDGAALVSMKRVVEKSKMSGSLVKKCFACTIFTPYLGMLEDDIE